MVRAAASGGRGGGSGGSGGREPLLTVDGITKTHDGESILFSDVTFTVHRGDRLAIVGPNGSGAPRLACFCPDITALFAPSLREGRQGRFLGRRCA